MKYWLAFIALLFCSTPAFAHKAPSGWEYPTDCCADEHCHPLTNDMHFTAIEQPDGRWLITFTFHGRMVRDLLWKGQIRASGDSEWHICPFDQASIGEPPNYTHCLIIPMSM